MTNLRYTHIYIGALLLSALAFMTNLTLPNDYLIMGLTFAVIFLGLPHGALDFAVAKSLSLICGVKSAILFMLGYVAIAAISIAFWLAFPATALIIFLSISVYHFCADWRAFMPLYARLSLAAIIICGPAVVYSNVVISLFTSLLVSTEAAIIIIQGMQTVFAVSLIGFSFFVVRYLLSGPIKPNISKWRVAEWLLVIVSSVLLTPLLHFGLYFCLLHSPKHLEDVSHSLHIKLSSAVIKSVPFVVLTLLIGIAVYYGFTSQGHVIQLSTALLRWIFIGLFGLTMSHMLLITLWHRATE